MKALVVVDNHLVKTPDGKCWAARIYNYSFFARYLSVFDEIRVAIRIKEVDSNKEYPNLCSGKGIEFCAIEEFQGPKEYILKYAKIQKNIRKYFDGCDCAIFRIPSTVGFQFWNAFKKTGRPYAVEVVVDPWDFAAPGRLKTPFRPIIRQLWTHQLKEACMKANGVSYVTQYALQKRYPSNASKNGTTEMHFESYYSSANIPSSYYGKPKTYPDRNKVMRIVHVANSISDYVKGHKELITSVAILKEQGINVEVYFIGEGSLVGEFKEFAIKKSVEERVHFIGKLPTPEMVRTALKDADLFVFPSYAEGLPRALIEAMSVGLPAVSTKTNGIPELLEDKYLVEPGQTKELAEKIAMLINNEDEYSLASKKNISKAMEYCEDILQERRNIFYSKLY